MFFQLKYLKKIIKILICVIRISRSIAILTLTTPFALPIFFSTYRFINPNVKRIGHLCADLDVYLKKRVFGDLSFKAVVLATTKQIANKHIVDYFSDKGIIFIKNTLLCIILRPLAKNPICSEDISQYSETIGSSEYHRTQSRWGSREPLLRLTDFDLRRGRSALQAMGVPEGAWHVCIHSRESGYSGKHDFGQSFRNSDIDTYDQAIDEVIRRGGWCFRMGDETMKPVQPRLRLIDYAHHKKNNSDWLDVYLCATAKIFLGNTSGAFGMSSVFGVPVATANMIPLGAVLPGNYLDLSIPKLYTNKKTGLLENFKTIFETQFANARTDHEIANDRFEIVNNSPEDIKDLLIEQLDRIDGKFKDDADDISRQEKFRSYLKPGHYSFQSQSKISSVFLKKYQHLL